MPIIPDIHHPQPRALDTPDTLSHAPGLPETVDWQGAMPFSPRYGDRYHSSSGARAQAEHVFLGGCGLPGLWQNDVADSRPDDWLILETGFGLGLNFLATWACWLASPWRPARLRFVSLEAHPVSADDIRRAAALDPVLHALGNRLASAWPEPAAAAASATIELSFEQAEGRLDLLVLLGDARPRLEDWQQRHGSLGAQSVFLDGFNPRNNPEIWSADTLRAVAAHCRPGARLATWCVARAVRDAATAGGFSVHRRPGLPPKRDCLAGCWPGPC